MHRTAVLLLASLTLAACGDAADVVVGAPSPSRSSAEPGLSPSTGASPTPATRQQCTHPAERYTVTYPADWHVADDAGVEPCSFFHPEPLELQAGTEADGVAVRLDVLTQPFPEAQRMLQEAGGKESSAQESVHGRDAVRLQGRTTGAGLLPAGLAVTTWLVDIGDRTLLLTTDEGGRDDYEQSVEVLDAMARSVQVA